MLHLKELHKLQSYLVIVIYDGQIQYKNKQFRENLFLCTLRITNWSTNIGISICKLQKSIIDLIKMQIVHHKVDFDTTIIISSNLVFIFLLLPIKGHVFVIALVI